VIFRAGGRIFTRAAFGVTALVFGITAVANATPLASNPDLDKQLQGLSIAQAGVGLEDLGAGTKNININIGGPVQKAILYWAGRQFDFCANDSCFLPPTPQPFRDQELRFDGIKVTGAITGIEVGNIGYKADVTGIVSAKGTGLQSFSIQDFDTSAAKNLTRLNGAGLLILYNDPALTGFFRVIVFEGLDFAFGKDIGLGPGALVTTPVTFNYSAEPISRSAEMIIFAGDAEAGRPDRIDVSNNPSHVDQLNSTQGPEWDNESFLVTIPAGNASTTVQLVSPPELTNPDSLLWVLGALRLPVEVAGSGEGCTPGYWKNHLDAWTATGFSPGATLESVFDVPDGLGLDAKTLHQALSFGGGSGVLGGANFLLRAGVASLLNSAHPEVSFPRTPAEVINDVNAALASNDRNTMLALASTLDEENNAGCPLN
jgi:hypothetical protein